MVGDWIMYSLKPSELKPKGAKSKPSNSNNNTKDPAFVVAKGKVLNKCKKYSSWWTVSFDIPPTSASTSGDKETVVRLVDCSENLFQTGIWGFAKGQT